MVDILGIGIGELIVYFDVSLSHRILILPPLHFSDFLHQVSLLSTISSDEARFSKKKIPGPKLVKMGPKWPKFGVFVHFESLDFSDFAYCDRQQ